MLAFRFWFMWQEDFGGLGGLVIPIFPPSWEGRRSCMMFQRYRYIPLFISPYALALFSLERFLLSSQLNFACLGFGFAF